MSREYYYSNFGHLMGPVTSTAVRELVHQGFIGANERLKDDRGDWHDVREICEFDQRSNQLPARATQGESNLDVPPISQTEMRRLFAECVQNQRLRDPTPKQKRAASRPSRVSPFLSSVSARIGSLCHTFVEKILIDPAETLLNGSIFRMTLPAVSPLQTVTGRLWLVSLVVVLVAAFFVLRIDSFCVTQPKIFETLDQTWAKLKTIRSNGGDSGDWEDFQYSESERLNALIPQIQAMADMNDQVSMSLLWVARDFLPAILKNGLEPDMELEKNLEMHLSRAKLELDKRAKVPAHVDFWIVTIIGLDVAVLAFVTWRIGVPWIVRRD